MIKIKDSCSLCTYFGYFSSSFPLIMQIIIESVTQLKDQNMTLSN